MLQVSLKEALLLNPGTYLDMVAALTPECRLREDLGVSSLEMLGVVLALEDQFSITIDEADLPGIATFQDVVAYIRAHT